MRRPWAALGLVSILLVASCAGEPEGEGARLLVASGFTDQVFVLDPESGAVLDSVAIRGRPFARDEPHAIAVSPEGDRWYLTLAHGEPELQVFERPGHRLIGALRLPMGGAARIGLTPDGRIAFVPDFGRSAGDEPGEVARIRTRTLEITHQVRVCPAPHDARVDPTGELVLVACAFGSEVVLLSAADLSELGRVSIGDGMMPMPMNVAWSPDGDRAWVTLMGGDRIVEIDREGRLVRSVDAGPQPTSLLATPDGRRLLVTNRQGRSLSIFHLPGLELELEVPLGDAPHPQGIAIDPTGRHAWISYEGEVGGLGGVVAVEIDSGELLWRTPVGAFVLGVAWAPALP